MANQSLFITSDSGKLTPWAHTLCVALLSKKAQLNIVHPWSFRTINATQTLIDFRSAIHRCQAAGWVNDAEFLTEIEHLTTTGLADWLDELIALALLDNRWGEL